MMTQPNLCRPQSSAIKPTSAYKPPLYRPAPACADPSAPAQAREVVLRSPAPAGQINEHSTGPAVRCGPPTLATSLVLSRLSNSPTLLPANVARLISAISMIARVSIRASGLFIECLLEACQLGTIGGLGLTRRMLITAVGSARTLQYVNKSLDWTGRDDDGNKTRYTNRHRNFEAGQAPGLINLVNLPQRRVSPDA